MSRVNYWLSRIVAAFVTILVALTIAFFLSRLAGGDPVLQMLGPNAPIDQIEARRAELGLGRPLLEQYASFLGGAARGDFGNSITYDVPNFALILDRLPWSLQLAGAALLIGVPTGLGAGIIAALRRDGAVDKIVSALALVGQSFPPFFIGLILILVFSVQLGLLPSGGAGSLQHLVLPAITLSLVPMAQVARLTRSAAVDILEQDYIRAARARGFGTLAVVTRQLLRSIAIPVITILGIQAGLLLSSTVTVEFVFGWPGLGSLTANAVQNRDFPLIQALVAFGVIVFVVINFTVDVIYHYIDPRVKVS